VAGDICLTDSSVRKCFWFHIALDDLDGTQGAEVCSGNRYNQGKSQLKRFSTSKHLHDPNSGWNFCMPEDSKG
jgi:hypothetical protein